MRDCHYRIKKWLLPAGATLGQRNVAHPALVNKEKVCLPLLHITLGLMKIFVQAKDFLSRNK
jgi:hypothetical protein